MAKSPSVTILERDMSSYTVTSSSTVLAVVGYATKGPIGKATMVISKKDFEEKFGTSVENSPYSALAVNKAFRQGNQIIFYRVANDTAVASEMAITNPIPGTAGYGLIETGGVDFTGLEEATEYSLGITFDGGGALDINLTTGAGQTSFSINEVEAAIAGIIENKGTISREGTKLKISTNIVGSVGSVVISDGNLISAANADNGVTEILASVEGTDAITNTTDNILFKAKEKGSSTNNIAVRKSSKINPLDNSVVHMIEVLYGKEVKETYTEVSLVPSNDRFFAKLMNADIDNGGSKLLEVEVQDPESDDLIVFPNNIEGEAYHFGEGLVEFEIGKTIGQYDYRVGTDGIPTLPTEITNLFKDALSTGGDLGNADEFDYHILITPDCNDTIVQQAALDLAQFRKDFIYVVDPPMGLNFEQVADWHNGKGSGRDEALDSSYAATYWPWLKTSNPDNGEYIWCPPSVFIAEKYMEIDRLYGPWYAPAGASRGRVVAADYETSPSFPQRELIYGDFNAINPFVNFSSKGLLIYGQKTLLRKNSALNRVNTRRMVIYIKKLIKKAVDSMLFEPHNPESWKRATAKIVSILEPVKVGNGLDQYKVIIDSSVNTPDVIAQSIMKGTIKIVPTGTIEIIELTLQVNKSGSSLSE